MKIRNSLLMMVALAPVSLFAAITHAPSNFKTTDGLAVFVDFTNAEYNITYDSQTKLATAVSKITFTTTEEGNPIFDMVENPTQVTLDNEAIKTLLIDSPDRDTKFRMAVKTVQPGVHTFIISSPLKEGVKFIKEGVSSSFWFSDLDDRSFLEAYLPANFEYDQYKMIINVDFKDLANQKFYTNGEVTKKDNNQFTIEFPETYTSSSLYFHTAPINYYPEKNFNFRSIDGRDIPVVAYTSSRSSSLETLKAKITKSLETLESKYGPFLHSKVTVFNSGLGGGMEYCGATMTDLSSLNHELTHSYFARGGFMPANGNSGWLDEAITSWSDEGSAARPDISGMYSNMAGNSEYRRITHMDAYSKGKNFMAHLNYKFQANGGLTSFLNQMIQTDSFKPMTTEEFIKKISTYYGEDLNPLFKKHTYSKGFSKQSSNERHVHMKLSIKEMKQFL